MHTGMKIIRSFPLSPVFNSCVNVCAKSSLPYQVTIKSEDVAAVQKNLGVSLLLLTVFCRTYIGSGFLSKFV